MIADLGAMLDRVGNVRYQRALFGADFASLNAKTPIDAMWSVTVRTREDRYRAADAYSDAQLGAAFDQNVSASAHGMRPIGVPMRITPGKIGRSGHRNFLFEQFVIRLYFFIRNWPVHSDAIFRVNAEIRRVQTRSEARPMNRTAADPSPAVVCAEGERIFTACYAQLVPIELIRASFVAHPISLGIPKWPCFESDDAKSGASQSLQQHPARRTHAHDAVVHLLGVSIAAHRQFDVLYRPQHVFMLWRSEGAEERRFQCVPPCPGLALCSDDPPTGVNSADGETAGGAHSYRRSSTSHGSGSPFSRRMYPRGYAGPPNPISSHAYGCA